MRCRISLARFASALVLGACTRASAPEIPAAPVVVAPSSIASTSMPEAAAPVVATAADAGANSNRVHLVSLPPRWYQEEYDLSGEMDIAPGDPPSPQHAAGTVFVAEAPASTNEIVVSEWDLATGKSLRSTVLPLPPADGDVRMVRAGNQLHFVAWHFNEEIDYAYVTTSFQQARAERLGTVAVQGLAAIASEGSLAIVLVDGVFGAKPDVFPSGQPGYFAVTFDANGKRIAGRLLEKPHKKGDTEFEYSEAMQDNAIVLGGRAYVLLATPDPNSPHLLKLRPDLSVERELPVHVPGDEYQHPTLTRWQDRIGVDCPESETRILLSTAPAEIERGRACPAPHAPGDQEITPTRAVWVGRVHVALYPTKFGKAHLAWAEEEPPASPALCDSAP